MYIHWVSAQDLLMRASWATESDLLELLLPATTEATRCLLVLDDLHILGNEDSEDPFRDPELLSVNNSILVALDRVSRGVSSFVLGICHVASQLPNEFARIGRLEKEIHMPPPTQVQREEILASILHDATNENKRHRWAECLASQTAGCVALDLRRLCADAWTKARSRSQEDVEITWNDLREAAQICVPSQLAQLDVSKTAPYPEEDGAPDILKVHEWSWRDFGGYSAVKKRLFRTVVMPWRRFISVSGQGNDENLEIQESWITPPSGVLFHGPPGVGKTFAASCLASSLGLHVVKVRCLYGSCASEEL
jgi:SpoVK/Ycf46/Vps4 family AAA+-type ATPase